MTRTEAAQVATLDPLEDRYEIIGELGGRRDARTFIARQRHDGADVLVSVFARPEGDEGNALSHLASDANRLAQHAHPNLVRVHEARWLDNETIAVVTDRVRHPTLEELLIRRNEAFSCPRVAMLLRDINGVLEWAREERIVHRHVDASSIFVEPGSDRVLMTFVPRPLPLADMPGPNDDARTIATLARAMLTRSVADPERDKLPLGELRPGLPDRLVEQTDELLHPRGDGQTPDVSEYIAIVAMSDNLKRAETECAETTRKLLEEERQAREQIEARRQATERAAAEQARLFQLEREAFSKEREGILGELQKQREELERQRAALARERAEHEQDRAVLVREREEHRRWAAEVEKTFAAQRAALEQQIRAAQERVSEERAEIDRVVQDRVARELAARLPAEGEADGPSRPAAAAAAPGLRLPRRRRGAKEISVPLALPPKPRPHRVKPQWVRRIAHAWSDVSARLPKPRWNRKWNVPAAAAALLLLAVVSAVAIVRGRGEGEREDARALAATRVTDSAAGRLESGRTARPVDPPELPVDFVRSVRRSRESGVPADLLAGVRARSDSATRGTISEGEDGMIVYTPPPSSRRTTAVERRSAPAPASRQPSPTPRPATQVDTTFVPPAPAILNPPVSPVTRDTLRRDTLSRPRPDSAPRDTLPRPSS